MALGYPLDLTFSLANFSNQISVSRGVVSSLKEDGDSGVTLIQTDAQVNPGSSGGPLLDQRGEVIGIVSSKVVGSGIEGIALAVHAKHISPLLKTATALVSGGATQIDDFEFPPLVQRSAPSGYRVEEFLLGDQVLSLYVPNDDWTAQLNFATVTLSDGFASGIVQRGIIIVCPTAEFYARGTFGGYHEYRLVPAVQESLGEPYDAVKAYYEYKSNNRPLMGIALFVRGPTWCLRADMHAQPLLWDEYEEIFETIIDSLEITDQ